MTGILTGCQGVESMQKRVLQLEQEKITLTAHLEAAAMRGKGQPPLPQTYEEDPDSEHEEEEEELQEEEGEEEEGNEEDWEFEEPDYGGPDGGDDPMGGDGSGGRQGKRRRRGDAAQPRKTKSGGGGGKASGETKAEDTVYQQLAREQVAMKQRLEAIIKAGVPQASQHREPFGRRGRGYAKCKGVSSLGAPAPTGAGGQGEGHPGLVRQVES